MTQWIDIGNNHRISYTQWKPNRELNPQYAHLPDVEKYGLIDEHKRLDDGHYCSGIITFDSEVAREISPDSPKWIVSSWEPLTVSPSLLCRACGDHGWIRDGKWVPA